MTGAICCRAALISSSVTGATGDVDAVLEVDDGPFAGTVLEVEEGSSLTDKGFES